MPFGFVPPSEVKPYFALAKQYTFGDRTFQTNQGPSFPAHQYIIAGTSTDAVGSVLLAAENPQYASNMLNCDGSPLSFVRMIDPLGSEQTQHRPCFDHPTLFDLLDARGVSWRYYDAMTYGGLWSGPDAIQHIRFGSDWSNVTSPGSKILTDISNGQLSGVSWVIPTARSSDHALVTDGSGPDKRGYVSHVQHEFGSIIHFIESTYGLGSLGYTDARADNLADCFDFTQTPGAFTPIAAGPPPLNQPPESAPPDGD